MGCRLSGGQVTALPRGMYRDPLDILIEQESRTCKGCAHIETMVVFGERVMNCNKAKKVGIKCRQYKESE